MKSLKRGLFIVSVGSLYYLYMFYIRVLPTVMVDELVYALSLTAKGTSLITSSFVIPYALVQIPAGILVDRIGPKRVMMFGMVGCCLGSYLFQLADSLALPVLARVMIGISCGAAFIAPMALAKQWLPKNMFATCAGLIQLLGCLGAMLSTPAAYLVETIGWRDTFLYSAFIALILIAIFSLLVQENRQEPTVTSEKNIIKDLKTLMSDKKVWYVGFIAMASWSVIGGFAEALGIKFISNLSNISVPKSSEIMSMAWISIAIISPVAGYWSEHVPNKCRPVTIMYSIALITFGMIISGYITNPTYIAILLFIAALSSGGQPIAFGLIADVAPPHLLATAVSFCNACVIAGAFILQPLIGFILDFVSGGDLSIFSLYDFQLSFLPISITLLIGIYISLILPKTQS